MKYFTLISYILLLSLWENLEGSYSSKSIQTISSLLYYVNDLVEKPDSNSPLDGCSDLLPSLGSINELSLWNTSAKELENSSLSSYLTSARHSFEESIRSAECGIVKESYANLRLTSFYLTFLWLSLNKIEPTEISDIVSKKFKNEFASLDTVKAQLFFEVLYPQKTHSSYPCYKLANSREEFAINSEITPDLWEKVKPYLISKSHPLKKNLDAIFYSYEVTQNTESLKNAGFKVLFKQPRSYIRVVKHPKLPNHLLKLYPDDETRQKKGKPSWFWLLKRCQGAKKIRQAIYFHRIKYFQVPQKWLYPSPNNHVPLFLKLVSHPLILLVEDMHLKNKKTNLHAWKNLITKKHLDELYIIISRAHGSSYRPDNITYSKNGKFSFIDTEYPSRFPDYRSIRHYLSIKMLKYWDSLVKNGGSSNNK
jgi:hypothetical protein